MSTPMTMPRRRSGRNWVKRLGWAGFLFFLVKGLVWLAILFGAGRLFG